MRHDLAPLAILSGLLALGWAVDKCGRPKDDTTSFVFGGEDFPPHLWPWMVSIRTWKGKEHVCGGVLIHPKLVLTAAHCLYTQHHGKRVEREPSSMFVATGAHYMSNKMQGEKWDSVKKFKVHPKWNTSDLYNYTHDLAVLEVKRANNNQNVARSICVPRKKNDARSRQQGWGCVVLGWGETEDSDISEQLKHALIPVQNQKQCEKLWNRKNVDPSMFCAGRTYRRNRDFAEGPCVGDSGGPLMCSQDSDTWYVLGVVSWGSMICMRNRPSLFSNVPAMSDWVKKAAKDMGYMLPDPKGGPGPDPPRPATDAPCRSSFSGKLSQLRVISRLVVDDNRVNRRTIHKTSTRDCVRRCLVMEACTCKAIQYYPRERKCVMLSHGHCDLADDTSWIYPSKELVVYIDAKQDCD